MCTVPCVSCWEMRAGLHQPSSQSPRCCSAWPVTDFPVHISSPMLPIRISKGAPAISIQGDSPQAVHVEMEVRTRAKSHIVERQLLRWPQVSALLRALLHSGPSAPSASSCPSCSRTEKLASLPCGCLGRVSHAHRGFTLFEIKNRALTLQLQVVRDSSNSLFPKCFSLP